MQNKAVIVLIVLLLAGGIYFLSSGNSSDTEMMKKEVAPKPEMVVEKEDSYVDMSDEKAAKVVEEDTTMIEETAGVVTVEVEGGAFYFDPKEITVNKGDTVKIVFTNVGGVHDWVIDEFDARTKVLQAGETETITFVADQTGTFEYYCSVGNHRAQGMVGNLIVKEALQ